ncbi:MAG TPA: matrixin family metalloprotease, partial [Labilithrix sp.]|nr:matrixin family metalloprotease [Labilithrix sp.]
MLRFILGALMGLVAFVATLPAAAYCRKTTASDASESVDPARAGACESGAGSTLPLYWTKSCIEYRIVVDPALEAKGTMTYARAADIVHRAAAAWATAQCPSASGGTRPVAVQTVDVALGRCANERWSTHNEIRFTTEPSDGDTLAVTDLAFDAGTGSVLTAVTRVFDVYDGLGATPAESDPHVEYVVRHELGHFLGLAHSERSDAVMNARFRARASDGLTADDVKGICDAYSADAPVGAGCGVAREPRGLAGPAVIVALALLVLLKRRRAAAVVLGASLLLLTLPLRVARAAPGSGSGSAATSRPAKESKVPAKGAAGSKPKKTTKKKPVPAPASAEPSDEALTRLVPQTIPEPRATSKAAEPAPPKGTLAMKMPAAATEERPDPSPPRPAPAEPDVVPAASRGSDLYLGAGYRAFVMPRLMLGVVGRANKDPFFQSASIEAAFHARRGVSIAAALTFADLSTGDMLVGARSNALASSFSYVRSDLKALAGSVQLVWSLPISGRVELELGLEL